MKNTTNAEAWDKISDAYQSRYNISTDSYYYGPLCPNEEELQLLGNVTNKSIIEIGAGAGQNSIYLAKNGAKCTALDISEKQINYGKQLAEDNGVKVEYIVGDFEKLDTLFELKNKSFDIVVSSYALQYTLSNESLKKTFVDIASLLKPGGFVVVSLDHPIRAHGWWNSSDQFVLDKYFDTSPKVWNYAFPETNSKGTMIGSFKTSSEYINAILLSGLNLEKIIEPKPIKEDKYSNFGRKSQYGVNAKQDPFSYEHLSRVPGTIIFVANKHL